MIDRLHYSVEDLRILLIGHLEGTLSEEEEAQARELIQNDPEVDRELEALRIMMDTLASEARLLCPTPEELAEFLESGEDSADEIASHVDECEFCREEAGLLGARRRSEHIPHALLQRIQEAQDPEGELRLKVAACASASPLSPRALWHILKALFTTPMLVGAVAAAVLAVVVIYPNGEPSRPMKEPSQSQPPPMRAFVPLTNDRGPHPKIAAGVPATGASVFCGKLIEAAKTGRLEETRRLLFQRRSAGCKDDEFGATPLHWAAYEGHGKVAALLVEKGYDVNATNRKGQTPLMMAAWTGHPEVVKLLLEHDADPRLRDRDGRTALEIAKANRNEAVVDLLKMKLNAK